MLTFHKKEFVETKNGVAINYVEGACLYSDTKPTTGIANGSVLVVMDSSQILFYDEAGQEWREF